MKSLILSYLGNKETSVSGLSRILKKDGFKVHRLFLSGYLQAMADLGVLRVKEIPPSKVYTTSSRVEKNIYEVLGDKCRMLGLDDRETTSIAVYILQSLFHRPIFLQEVKGCGLGDVVLGKRVTGEERSEARKALLKSGFRLPTNDPAYLVDKEKGYDRIRDAILQEILIEKFKAQGLVLGPKQTRLRL
ncbi:MAG: hypothetical protein ACE5KV_05755 [Thermoplasmata archaeon]